MKDIDGMTRTEQIVLCTIHDYEAALEREQTQDELAREYAARKAVADAQASLVERGLLRLDVRRGHVLTDMGHNAVQQLLDTHAHNG